ncbi:aldo/keto reductase [Brachybacterium hainanense]|uniref:Aldo/keto reductase n=1 Tax=Brachybacterium hainanense TaxID=1541174 RepID=A0ABV6RE91_9MICO
MPTAPSAFGDLVLGGNVFGWTADAALGHRILDAFVDAGGTAVDTADVYSAWVDGNSGGESEEIIGSWLTRRTDRDALSIATKVFSHPRRPGLSPANIRGALEDSLRRLRTDHVDLYYAHRDDPEVPQEEYLGVLHELVTEGKIREIGASNFEAGRLRSAAAITAAGDLTPVTVAQDRVNLVERAYEQELAPTLAELGIVELPYSSLASGFLSGKYRPGREVDSVRAGGAGAYLEDPRNVALLEVLDEIAAGHGVGISAIALSWLRSRPAVAAPIASARTLEQLAALVRTIGLELSTQEVAALDAASAHRLPEAASTGA